MKGELLEGSFEGVITKALIVLNPKKVGAWS